MKRTKKYIAIFLALLILTSTISTQNVYADQNDTHEVKTTVSEEEVIDHSEDTTLAESQVDKAVSEEEKENNETDTTATKADGIEENVTNEEIKKETETQEEPKQSTDSKEKEENKSEPENEKDEAQDIIQVNTEELSERIADLYGEIDFDSSNTYTTKTLIVVSDHSDFDNGGAIKIIQYDTMYILQYDTEDATKKAYKNLKKDDSIHSVEVDSIIESKTESNSKATETSNKKSQIALYLDTKEKTNDIKIAILDTGIDLSNHLLQERLIDLNVNLSSTGNENSIDDDNGHGTDMAEIIVNNTPHTVKVMPIKVANNNGKATILNTYLGMEVAIENKADLINISMGTIISNNSTILASIIEEAVSKNITVVAAAGNDNTNVAYYTPANIDSVITVSATDTNGTIASFSNYGDEIDYSSQGEDGTSTAAANVSAIIGIIKSIYPEYKLEDIQKLLNQYAVDMGEEGFDKYYGNGFISLQAIQGDKSDTEKEDSDLFGQLNWKNISDEEFNKALYQAEQYMVGKFLSDLDKEDVNLALSKSEYINNITVVSKFDDEGNLISQEEINCYQYCLNEYEIIKEELMIYGDADMFKKASATINVNINSTDGAFTSNNKVTIKGANKKLSSYSVWVNGGKALTGLTMTTTSENSGGANLGFAIATNAWSYGIYLSGNNKDTYDRDTHIRQAGAVFQVKYSKPTGYQLKSVSGSYPKAMFSGLSKNGTGTAGSESTQLWKYGSNSDSSYVGGSDNANSTDAFNKSTPSIWIVGDLEKIISSAPTLTITYEPIQYLQTVNVSYQKADGNYADPVKELSSSFDYGTTFSWSINATSVYEAASIESYTVKSDKINPVSVKRNSNISAEAKPDREPINGWYKGLPEIKVTGKDPNLDIKNVTIGLNSTVGVPATKGATASLTAEEGEKKYKYYATNVNDVSSKEETITIKADNSKPKKISLTAPTEWTNSTVPLTLKGEDTLSGLASFKVYYSSDNTTWSEYGTVKCNGETTLKEDSTSIKANKNGYYVLIVTDRVGNEDTSSVLMISNIDRSAPTLKYEIEGDKRKNNWYRGDAELNLTASDETGGSGVQSITVNSNLTIGDKRTVEVTKEGANVYICYATDFARNETNPRKEITVKVDKSTPINLSMTPNTTEWTKNPVIITAKAEDTYSGVDTIELQYTKDNKHPDWRTYKTGDLDGANQATYNFSVTDNGYYRMIVTDQVGYQETSDILKVTNYDPDAPDANTIGIEPNTIQWVDESTGVEVTSYGSDELSGLSSVEVMERNKSGIYETKKSEGFYGETTIESATYDTHINERYKTKVVDQAGNDLVMKDEEALKVDNIDPEAPELTIESISPQDKFISTQKGYVIRSIIEDSQSGFAEASLQKLNESGEWEDYKAQYQIIRTEEEEESNESAKAIQVDKQEEEPALTKVARERVIVMAASNVYLASSDTKDEETEEEVREQGETKVIIEYTVRENGTYRLRGADLVQNTAYTNDTIEITNLDGSMPEIQVEGNPIVWQNQDAMIKVVATDEDSEISDMTLDGEKKAFLKGEDGAFYFTFDATKNQEFSVSASDEAGNTTTRIIKVTKIDKEAPVLNTTIKKSWLSMIFGNYRNLKLDTNDDLSGIATVVVRHQEESTIVAEYPYENVKISFKGDYKIKEIGDYEVIITDHAGNVTMQTISESNLDFNAPWLKVEGNPTIWQNTDATIKVTAFDEDSAIAKMTLNGIEQEFELESQGEAVFTFTVTKNEKFLVVAYDEANHATSQVIEVTKIDKEKPTLETLLTARWQEEGYRNLGYEGFDNLSGIATITLEYEGVKETLNSFEYKAEQKTTANDYQMTQNGDYLLAIKDHAGNSSQVTVTEKEAKILKAMEVVIPPKKIKYKETEDFKKKGMVVDAIYNNNSRKENIKDYVILDGTNLVLAQGKINLSYTEDGKTVYTDTPIQVIAEPLVAEESESPVTPEESTPVTPKTPISPSPTPVTPTTEKEINEVKKEVKEEATKVVNEMPENTGVTKEGNRLPIGAILAGLVFLMLLLFLLLLNVKVYNKDEEGEWKFLGKTRAIKVKDQYVVKISRFVRTRAVSNSYQLVFSRMFKKFHDECDVIIKIDQQDYERHLEKESDTVYVEYNE